MPRLAPTIDWKYALRELTLIITGILIALWLNNWNTNRHQRRAELSLLREIRTALVADLAAARAVAEAMQASEQRTTSLLEHIRAGRPYSAELDALFGSAYGFRVTELNAAPYEALRARGLDLVANDSVRMAIIRVYENGAAGIRRADDVSTNVSFDVLRPYYLQGFSNIQFLDRATPHDYEAVARDPYFHNLLDYRLTVLRRSVIPRYESATADMARLVDILDHELARRTGTAH